MHPSRIGWRWMIECFLRKTAVRREVLVAVCNSNVIGQLDKWVSLYPWFFKQQAVPISKTQRRSSVRQLLEAIRCDLRRGFGAPMYASAHPHTQG